MANSESSKGNPAATRMRNANLKARRGNSWRRGQERAAKRAAAQHQREADNRTRLVGWMDTLRMEGVDTTKRPSKLVRMMRRQQQRRMGGAA